jgi:acyl transferase domain-containing protein
MSDFLNRISHYSAKRLALLSDELFSRVQELERAQDERIAIVGIGCRFPGGARSPEQLWQLTRAGVDAITEVPPDRWNVNALYDPDPEAPGKMSTRWGGFIDRTDEFDPHFFGISPREAQSMDPQQRVVLEVAWEALEHASISPQRLEGTRTSVYLGVSAADYYQLIRAGGVANLDAYTASGVAHSIASGRLSYFLGIRGPSMSIDTACSSSLVAIHHAVNSLRRGECSMALAGGVNLVLGPEITIALSKSRMMAPDGRCKVFDSRADGFVRSEGCGILVLKRLRDAQADGDRIIAVIRGTAANHDGRSNGLTAPNGPSQEAVLREALANGGVQPHEVDFVEAHGTGTSLGDPIEVQALGAVLGAERAGRGPLLVGSIKANIGHLEASAGVAGLIKLAMALKHGEIPAQIHIQKPNPHIAWDGLAVRVPTSLTPWPSTNGGRRIGGVSSLGFSGTNVHMVLEQAPEPATGTVAATAPDRNAHVIALSGRSAAALATLAASYAKHLHESEDSLASVAFTLNAGRAHFAHRAAFTARSKTEAVGVLEKLADGGADVAVAGVASGRAPRIAFLFTGQGSQYVGMARALFESEPQLRATLEQCNELLRPHFPRPLLSVLYPEPGETSPIDDTEYTQQALFCIEYALATLWMSWGVRPAMVMGHSIGEVVAACVAGVFSLEDALKLVASRGKLMGALPRNGGMVSVLATHAQVTEAIAPWRAEVGIAAVNGHDSIVVSGLLSSLKLATARLTAAGMKCTELNVSHGFHSPLMRPILADFERTLAKIAFSPPRIDLVSTVTGQPIGAEVASAAYWSDQIGATVQFEPALQSVAKAGCDVFLEVGPQPTLLGMGRQCVSNDGIVWLPSLRRGHDDWTQMLESLAALYVRGVDIDWLAFDFAHRHLRVTLPGYPFDRERFWVSSAAVTPDAEMPAPPVSSRVLDMIHEIVWREAGPAGMQLPNPQSIVDAVAVPGESSGPVLSQQALYIAKAPAQEARAPSRFVVVPDRQGFALTVAQSLRAGGDMVDVVSAQNANSLAANLRAALAAPCDGVVFLPTLDVAVRDEIPADTLLADQQNLLSAALAVVHTIGVAANSSPRLWLVTRGAQAIDAGDSANPAQAIMWGFSHVVALERPELSCTRVDLDVSASMQASVEGLVAELRAAGLEDQIAFRGEQRLVRRLTHHRPRAQTAPAKPISACKSYLITGGLRGLGLRVAEWLADQGARHIVLMGRGAPGALTQQTLERLQGRGVRALAVRGDIGLRKDVERVLETIAASGATLGGIIHAAGILDDGVLSSQNWPRFEAAMSPKVRGTWLLHTLARDLDFLVLFSSGASLAGSAGQANYAAANAFMDGLAWYRQAQGLPTVSINWGPWADIGAAADRQVGVTGLRPIEVVDGLAALGYAICGQGAGAPFPSTQLAVFCTNWSHLVDGRDSGHVAPLFAELAAEAARNSPKTAGETVRRSAAPSLRECLMAAAPNRRKTVLRNFVRQQTANVLGVQRAEDLDENEPLRQLGLDSLMAVQLRNVLGKAVDRTLPVSVTFDNPSLSALVEFLYAEVFAADVGEFARETPRSLAASDGALESMTEDQLALQVAARLEGIARGDRL